MMNYEDRIDRLLDDNRRWFDILETEGISYPEKREAYVHLAANNLEIRNIRLKQQGMTSEDQENLNSNDIQHISGKEVSIHG